MKFNLLSRLPVQILTVLSTGALVVSCTNAPDTETVPSNNDTPETYQETPQSAPEGGAETMGTGQGNSTSYDSQGGTQGDTTGAMQEDNNIGNPNAAVPSGPNEDLTVRDTNPGQVGLPPETEEEDQETPVFSE